MSLANILISCSKSPQYVSNGREGEKRWEWREEREMVTVWKYEQKGMKEMNECKKRSRGGEEGRGSGGRDGIDWEGGETEWLPLALLN